MGGDHKCPHVGRHLRAHTGDRPYECKECPLRFARSDLLSRHVNKAHRPPGEEDKKDGRRGRRKSLGSQSQSDKEGLTMNGSGGVSRAGPDKIRAASFSQFGRPDMSGLAPAGSAGFDGAYQGQGRGGLPQAQPHVHAQQGTTGQSHAQTALPAHAMYPHHPLLSDSPRSSVSHNLAAAGLVGGTTGAMAAVGAGTGTAQWAYQPGVNGYIQPTDFTNPFSNGTQNAGAVPGVNLGMAGHPYAALGMSSPFTATPMRFSASGSAIGAGMGMAGLTGVPGMPGVSSTMGRNTSNYSGTSIDYGNKKRACDQCNHSKVRCDFNDPCARCTTRNLGCSYNKPPKSRSIVQPMPWAAQRLSMPNMGSSAANVSLSLSPTTSTVYSSPSSQPSLSPTATTATIGVSGVAGAAQQPRSQSFGGATQAQYYPSAQAHMPGALAGTYQQAYPALQGWQAGVGMDQGAGAAGFVDYSAMALPSTIDPLQTHDGQRSHLVQQQQPQHQVYGPTQPFYASPHAALQNIAPAIDPALGGSPLTQTLSHGNGQASSHMSMQPPPTIPQAPQRQSSNPASMRSEKSTGSPSSHLAPTPSLTSHSTSPSGSDEPAERRGSSMSAMAGVVPEPFVRGVDPTPVLQEATLGMAGGVAGVGGMGMALELSPSSMQPVGSSTVAPSSTMPSSSSSGDHTAGSGGASWQSHVVPNGADPNAGALRDRALRASVSTFDEDESRTRSRADSLSQSMAEEGGVGEGESAHRRRFSTSGVWANAFNAMSLQDQQLQPLGPVSNGIADPFSASQLAQFQSLQQQRPGSQPYGLSGEIGNGDGGDRMPSMSDVKDLWKLFMSEPMAGFTPVGEKSNAMEGSTDATPRPNLGNRTLSKSNSVPDLTSPFLGQAFFSNYLNTVTPRQEKGAMIGDAVEQDDKPQPDTSGLTEDEQARVQSKWKKEIQSRQTSFAFQPQMGGRLGKAGVPLPVAGPGASVGGGGLVAPTSHMYAGIPGMTSTAFGGVTFDLAGRPTASVLQAHAAHHGLNSNSRVRAMGMGGALDQTLAPERVPSFSMTPTLGQGPGGGAGAIRDGGFLRPAIKEGSKLSGAVGIAGRSGGGGGGANGAMGMGVDKETSANTRPGNKRLASQTLVPGDGKKAVFGFFDEEEDGTFA